jgi:hypothetical protein
MANPWLVRAITGRIRVKWRDEDGVLQDQDFDTEAEARAFGGSLLEFRGDAETGFLIAARLRQQHPEMSVEEAMARAGFVTEKFKKAES